jgi:hypothetical protein
MLGKTLNNIAKNHQERELTNNYRIHRKAVDQAIPAITNIQLADRGSPIPEETGWLAG